MLRTSVPQPLAQEKKWGILLISMVALETLLITLALVPASAMATALAHFTHRRARRALSRVHRACDYHTALCYPRPDRLFKPELATRITLRHAARVDRPGLIRCRGHVQGGSILPGFRGAYYGQRQLARTFCYPGSDWLAWTRYFLGSRYR